jgi:pyrroloquinoline quinone (PQQ) biosynthesis protein C
VRKYANATYRLAIAPQTLSAEDFVGELRAEARRLPIDPGLAQNLKYGKADLAHVRRWAKDYFRYIEHDPQATAATLARCLDRELFLELSGHLARKTGFFQTGNALELYRKFTSALGISAGELDAHYACAETLGAMFTKRSFQHSSFLEGFVASSLVSEGALGEATGDDAPFLCQKGFAEYLRRSYSLPEGATDYWRAYEDFRSLDADRAWQIVTRLAVDGSSQAAIRRAFRHTLSVYQSMRNAWSQLVAGTYWDAEIRWPK